MNDMIMLALGDSSTRTNLKYLLQELNLDIREVNQGTQAIRDVATLSPRMVIVDDSLSYLNGYQFCRLVKFGLHLDIPLILLISSQHNPDRFWGTSCGADYCLSKPLNAHELKEIVNELLLNKKARKFFFQTPFIGQHTSDLDILKIANDLMDRHLFQEKLLNELRSMNREMETVQDLVSVMMSILGSLFSYRSAAIFLYYQTKADLLLSSMQPVGQPRLDTLYASLLDYVKREEGLDLSLDDIPLTVLGPTSPEEEAEASEEFEDEGISIFSGEKLRSLICYVAFDGLKHETFPEEEARIFQLILQQAMQTLEEKVIFEKSIPFSIIDTVHREATNRSFFLKLLSQNMEQSRRFQIPLSLVILNLKNFPQVANSLGKKATFHFRQKVYQALLNAIRKMDIVARIEQNRFALVLFKANLEQARCVYQRVKTLLDEISLPNEALQIQGRFRPYDASFGVDAEEFLSTACSPVFSSLDTPRPQASHKKETPNKSGSAPKKSVAATTESKNAKK